MAEHLHCPHDTTCSGCSSIGVDYSKQLEAKLHNVRTLFEQSALRSFQASAISPVTPSPKVSAYRNRAKLVVARRSAAEHGIALGLYRAGTHEVVDIPGCPVQTESINAAVELIRKAVTRFNVKPYDESTHSGDLRFVTIRNGVNTGEILIGLVTLGPDLTGAGELASYVMEHCQGAVGVVQNINPTKGNVIFGSSNRLLAGRDYLEESVCDARIRLGITSFFQVNTHVAAQAYRAIVRGLTDKENGDGPRAASDATLLDLYAGVGTIGLIASPHVGRIFGIEEFPEAVDLSRAAAQAQGFEHTEFRCGLVEEVLPDLIGELSAAGHSADHLLVVVNPPRKGLHESALDLLIRTRPERIAYLSCSPATLLRDLVRFERGGLTVRRVELFDMFPQTDQIETLAILRRTEDD